MASSPDIHALYQTVLSSNLALETLHDSCRRLRNANLDDAALVDQFSHDERHKMIQSIYEQCGPVCRAQLEYFENECKWNLSILNLYAMFGAPMEKAYFLYRLETLSKMQPDWALAINAMQTAHADAVHGHRRTSINNQEGRWAAHHIDMAIRHTEQAKKSSYSEEEGHAEQDTSSNNVKLSNKSLRSTITNIDSTSDNGMEMMSEVDDSDLANLCSDHFSRDAVQGDVSRKRGPADDDRIIINKRPRVGDYDDASVTTALQDLSSGQPITPAGMLSILSMMNPNHQKWKFTSISFDCNGEPTLSSTIPQGRSIVVMVQNGWWAMCVADTTMLYCNVYTPSKDEQTTTRQQQLIHDTLRVHVGGDWTCVNAVSPFSMTSAVVNDSGIYVILFTLNFVHRQPLPAMVVCSQWRQILSLMASNLLPDGGENNPRLPTIPPRPKKRTDGYRFIRAWIDEVCDLANAIMEFNNLCQHCTGLQDKEVTDAEFHAQVKEAIENVKGDELAIYLEQLIYHRRCSVAHEIPSDTTKFECLIKTKSQLDLVLQEIDAQLSNMNRDIKGWIDCEQKEQDAIMQRRAAEDRRRYAEDRRRRNEDAAAASIREEMANLRALLDETE